MAYLADEVLRSSHPELQHFCAAPLSWSGSTNRSVAALAGDGDGQVECNRVIDRAVGERLFVTSLGEGWYRYHPLFRQLLFNQLRDRLPADGISELHRRAADWYDREEWSAGLSHDRRAGHAYGRPDRRAAPDGRDEPRTLAGDRSLDRAPRARSSNRSQSSP
ncbi:MAG: hypothetical protein IPF82_16440 [Blastocatellia bacterium]|nr:hypothetical protein [Blastocatellia bacterium]